jgi:membrane associated rhomboid family serine protease
MSRIRIGAPLTLLIVAGCVAGTYLPGSGQFGISGGLGSLLLPWTWLRLVTWPFVHADSGHLMGNMMLFLLLSPNLETKQGVLGYIFCLGLTGVIVGLGHLALGQNNTVLVGASGWVFMMILLSTFTTGEARTISVPTLLVATLYAWQEIRAAMMPNSISQFAHLLGGACGLAFGFFGSAQSQAKEANALPAGTK